MVTLQNELIDFVNERDNNARVIFGTLYRKKELVSQINEQTSYLPKEIKLAQRTYHIINDIIEIPICKVCTNRVNFKDFRNGYNNHCSVKCANNDFDIQERKKKTYLAKHGVENPSQNPDIQAKKKKTWLEIYGVDHPFKAKEIQDKRKETWIAKHGVDHISKSEAIKAQKKAKPKATYGTDNISQAPEIKAKKAYSLYVNGTGPCSKQQKYIHDLIGGELNYPVGRCMLDIAFPEDNVYFEYDGSGHDLTVKRGNITKDEFDHKELKRTHFLARRGWKKICLISRKDFLPSDERLLDILSKAVTTLKERSWVAFDVDKAKVQTSKFTEVFDFGELQKVKS